MKQNADWAGKLIENTPIFAKRFEVISILGQGAASAVFHVRDAWRGGADCALKVLANREAFDEHTLERFHRELEILRALHHPNIVQAYDYLESNNVAAFTLEYVRGCDLGRLVRERQLAMDEIKFIFCKILTGLSALHQRQIVHRDLKLENVLVGCEIMAPAMACGVEIGDEVLRLQVKPHGEESTEWASKGAGQGFAGPISESTIVKVSDLGIVKEYRHFDRSNPALLLGTVPYLPPEYVRYGRLDERGDLYAVGLMLYECLVGRRWLSRKFGSDAIDNMYKRNFEFPAIALEGLPRKYQVILRRALQPDPSRRYASAEEMLQGLRSDTGQEQPSGGLAMRGSIDMARCLETYCTSFRPEDRREDLRKLVSLVALVLLVASMGFAALHLFIKPGAVSPKPRVRVEQPSDKAY